MFSYYIKLAERQGVEPCERITTLYRLAICCITILPTLLTFWCHELDSNQPHTDFQSAALPDELPRHYHLAESRGVEPHPISENPVFKAGRRTNPAALLSIIFGTSGGIRTHINQLSVATGYKSAVLPLNYRGKFWQRVQESNLC